MGETLSEFRPIAAPLMEKEVLLEEGALTIKISAVD